MRALKTGGAFDRARDSNWRRRRLLILCYHSFAIDDENLWRPALFLAPARLRERFELLKQGGYNVLPLAEALQRLRGNDLPPRSVVLTFDDGTYDFHNLAYPMLKEYGFPATVYQTTHYSSRLITIHSFICSYMLWKKRDTVLKATPAIGVERDINLASPDARKAALNQVEVFADREQLSTDRKNDLAAELARSLGIDYDELIRKRIAQLMSPEEIAELAAAGINFELHTHRHRTPRDRTLFEKEIVDNRNALEAITKTRVSHFCYPSGDYDLVFLPWLAELGVASATTGDPGLASTASNPLLLPRFIDTTAQTELEFESWLTGIGELISAKAQTARLRHLVHL